MTSSSSSCSFRITRTAEDLAQTLNALSQRLVRLEQRQEALELYFSQIQKDPPAEEIAMLDGVDELLKECQLLLDGSGEMDQVDQDWSENQETLAA